MPSKSNKQLAIELLHAFALRSGYGTRVHKDEILTGGTPEWFNVFVPWTDKKVDASYTSAMRKLANGTGVKNWSAKEVEGLKWALGEGRFYFLRADKWEQFRGADGQVVEIRQRVGWVDDEEVTDEEGRMEFEGDETQGEEEEEEEVDEEDEQEGEEEEVEREVSDEEPYYCESCQDVQDCGACIEVDECEDCQEADGCGFWGVDAVCEHSGEMNPDLVEETSV